MVLTCLVSIVLGFLTGLGVGGGSLLILWLTGVQGWSSTDARGANLLFFLPGAALSLVLRHRQGSLPLKKVVPAIIGGCIAALLGAYLSSRLDEWLLKKLFGVLLLFTGIRELLYKPK